MTCRAKFYVTSKETVVGVIGRIAGWKVKLSPVYAPPAPNETDRGNAALENRIFGRNTPQGSIEMFLVNPIAAVSFEVGREYYVDFSTAHLEKEVLNPA